VGQRATLPRFVVAARLGGDSSPPARRKQFAAAQAQISQPAHVQGRAGGAELLAKLVCGRLGLRFGHDDSSRVTEMARKQTSSRFSSIRDTTGVFATLVQIPAGLLAGDDLGCGLGLDGNPEHALKADPAPRKAGGGQVDDHQRNG
jgi:hypothetical protein